jgi:hypothetical protein
MKPFLIELEKVNVTDKPLKYKLTSSCSNSVFDAGNVSTGAHTVANIPDFQYCSGGEEF